MSQLSEDEKDRLFTTLDRHTEQNEKIERGLYGDRPNNVKGALDQIEDLKNQIRVIQSWINRHNLKTAYMSGAVATFVVFVKMAWDYIMQRKS